MNNAATRTALKDALSTVDGVTGYLRRPRTPAPGDAWPLWRGAERTDEGWGYLNTWAVVIITPQDEALIDEWIDVRSDALDEALQPVLAITAYDPASLPAEGQQRGLFALMITGRTE